jgi:hypothetical protein
MGWDGRTILSLLLAQGRPVVADDAPEVPATPQRNLEDTVSHLDWSFTRLKTSAVFCRRELITFISK